MRASYAILAAAALAACSPQVPDSGRGVGFQDYDSYMAQRQAALAPPMIGGSASPGANAPASFSTSAAAAAISNAQAGGFASGAAGGNPLAPRSLQEQAAQLGGAAPAPVQPNFIGGADPNAGRVIGAAPIVPPTTAPTLAPTAAPVSAPLAAPGGLAAVRPRGNAPMGITETVSEMAVVGGVSDEQDFDAVAARETIESDRARIERNRAQYQIDQPGALPQRAGVGPSIVEYALSTQHPVGVKLFQRSPLRLKRIEVACAPYANADLAQEAFLAAGGPNRDRLGVDPDGDGYACGWDPSPYRAVVP